MGGGGGEDGQEVQLTNSLVADTVLAPLELAVAATALVYFSGSAGLGSRRVRRSSQQVGERH